MHGKLLKILMPAENVLFLKIRYLAIWSMKMVLIPSINMVYSCGIQIEEFFRRQRIKTEDSPRYKKFVSEIHPRSRKSNLTLHQYPCEHLSAELVRRWI
jgi:hypothetical protein